MREIAPPGVSASVVRLVTSGLQAALARVSSADGVTFSGAVVLAFAMTVAGSLLPALRATRVDPLQVIRSE
jgi:ABC-type antimicrobial peptide transport system permease subunit